MWQRGREHEILPLPYLEEALRMTIPIGVRVGALR